MTQARDLIVNLIGRAITTGAPRSGRYPARENERFYAGRSTAFVQAAAMAVEVNYGVELVAAQHWLNRRVRDIRRNTEPTLLRDEAYVGQASTTILNDMLASTEVAV